MLPSLLRPVARHTGLPRVLQSRHCDLGRVTSGSATSALSERLFPSRSSSSDNRLEIEHLHRSYTTSTPVSNTQIESLAAGDERAKDAWKEKLLPAFRAFKEIHGHLDVDADFVVPSDDTRWPQAAWGLALGETERQLQHQRRQGKKKLPARVVDDLDALGLVWDVAQFRWSHVFLPALRRFSELHGHTNVPLDFVVRDGDADWPEQSWRLPLGKTVAQIRSGKIFGVQVAASSADLEQLNFCSDTSIYDCEWREKVVPALDAFRHEHGHCIVKPGFVVPSSAAWPSKTWGLPLGAIAQGLRSGELYADQAARDMDDLNDLGFAWNTSDAEWAERISPALTTFVPTKGDFRVERSFVVPAQQPWPKRTHGLQCAAATQVGAAQGLEEEESCTRRQAERMAVTAVEKAAAAADTAADEEERKLGRKTKRQQYKQKQRKMRKLKRQQQEQERQQQQQQQEQQLQKKQQTQQKTPPQDKQKAKESQKQGAQQKQEKKQQQQQQQGFYADPTSPIASTPMKRQRTKAAENSKSTKSKHAPGSAASDASSSVPKTAEDEKFFSPRKLLNEYGDNDKKAKKQRKSKSTRASTALSVNFNASSNSNSKAEKAEKAAERASESSTSSSTASVVEDANDANDELFSPALKPPQSSQSRSSSPSSARVRLETAFASVSSPGPSNNVEEAQMTVVEETMDVEDDEEEAEGDTATEQEFNPFFFMKTLPKYEDIADGPRPVALPERSRRSPKTCLVLDLDETLVHCSVDEVDNPHLQFPVTFNGVEYTVNVKKRPHMEYFLKRVSKMFEVVVFTASHKVYAEKLMDMLDPHRNLIKYRLYREDCLEVYGNYLKDLNVLGRDLSKVVLVDNSPHAFSYQVNNGIPIETWYDDEKDDELLSLLPFLETLVDVDDVRPIVKKQFEVQMLIDATPDEIA